MELYSELSLKAAQDPIGKMQIIKGQAYVYDNIFELLLFKFMCPVCEEKENDFSQRLYRWQGSQEGETKKESEGAAEFAHQGVKREHEHLFLRY